MFGKSRGRKLVTIWLPRDASRSGERLNRSFTRETGMANLFSCVGEEYAGLAPRILGLDETLAERSGKINMLLSGSW